jgi:peptidoglycan hydrolase-like protein with peptidoglycan-binding domain
MADAELAAALKQAKSKKMFFAFVGKGTDGKLILSRTKIPPKEIAAAKKETGGGMAVTGKCFGDGSSSLVFLTAKPAPATLAAAIKKVAHRDAGVTIAPDVQVASDADEEEQDGTGAAASATAAPGATPAAGTDAATPGPAGAPAAGGQGKVADIQKALQKLGYDPGKIDGVMGPHTQAAIKKFQKANGLAADGVVGPKTQAALDKALQGGAGPGVGREGNDGIPGPKDQASQTPAPDLGPWRAARETAIKDLKALAAKVAGTKHKDAIGVLKEIQSIITNLKPNPAPNEIDKLEAYIRQEDVITAAEESPGHFHKLEIRKPLLAALEGLKKK